MSVHIRPAKPTASDAAAYAELANMASHGILADVIGPGYEQQLISRFLREDNLFGYRQVWFLDAGGDVAAMLCAFTGERKASLAEQTELDRSDIRPESAVLVRNQLQPVFDFIDTVPVGAFYVLFVAVYPYVRGNGFAGKLLAFASDLARETGSTTLELDVETGNEAALKAYLGQGLEIVRTSPTVPYDAQHRELAMHRMVKAIG